jgi:hypothetical protein
MSGAVRQQPPAADVEGPRDVHLGMIEAALARGGARGRAARRRGGDRLERVRELTGHDPQTPRGQEQLALGLEALAVRDAAAAVYSPR